MLIIRVTTTGSSGSASGSATSDQTVSGLLHSVEVLFHGSAPVTTEVTVTMGTFTVLNVTGSTDTMYFPRYETCDSSGVADGGTNPLYVPNLRLDVAVATSDALTDCVTIKAIFV